MPDQLHITEPCGRVLAQHPKRDVLLDALQEREGTLIEEARRNGRIVRSVAGHFCILEAVSDNDVRLLGIHESRDSVPF